jgi:cell division septation protein DedD
LKTTQSGEETPKNVASIPAETQKQGVEGIRVYEKPVTGPSAHLQAEAGNIEKPSTGVSTPEANPVANNTKISDIAPGPAANPVAKEKQAAAVQGPERGPVAKVEEKHDAAPGREANFVTENAGKDLAAAIPKAKVEERGRAKKPVTSEAPFQDHPAGVQLEKASNVTPQKMPKPADMERTFPYSLYLGSVPYPDQAEKGISRYQREGLTAYWVEVELSKGTWYRLYTGHFESPDEAEKFKAEKGLKHAEEKELPYANQIGIYPSKKKAKEKMEWLRSQGYSAYMIEDPKGKHLVYVGAFYGEDRA